MEDVQIPPHIDDQPIAAFSDALALGDVIAHRDHLGQQGSVSLFYVRGRGNVLFGDDHEVDRRLRMDIADGVAKDLPSRQVSTALTSGSFCTRLTRGCERRTLLGWVGQGASVPPGYQRVKMESDEDGWHSRHTNEGGGGASLLVSRR